MPSPFSIHGAPSTPIDHNFRATTPLSKRVEPSPGPLLDDDLHRFYTGGPSYTHSLPCAPSLTPSDAAAKAMFRQYIAYTPSTQSFATPTQLSFPSDVAAGGCVSPIAEVSSNETKPHLSPLSAFTLYGQGGERKVEAWIQDQVAGTMWTSQKRNSIIHKETLTTGIKLIAQIVFPEAGNSREGTARTDVDLKFDRQAAKDGRKKLSVYRNLAAIAGKRGMKSD